MISLVRFWSSIRKRITVHVETMTVSFCIIFSGDILIALPVNHMSSITMWWTRSMFPQWWQLSDHKLLDQLQDSVVLLNSTDDFCTVDNPLVLPTNVRTKSVWMSLVAKTFNLGSWKQRYAKFCQFSRESVTNYFRSLLSYLPEHEIDTWLRTGTAVVMTSSLKFMTF